MPRLFTLLLISLLVISGPAFAQVDDNSVPAEASGETARPEIEGPAGWEKRFERREHTGQEITTNLPHVPPDLEDYTKIGRHWHAKLSGYVHLDFITDLGRQGDSFAFTPSTIPVTGSAPEPQNGLLKLGDSVRLEARRTRLRADFYADLPAFTKGTRFYIESDFYGPNGAPRLRHAYVAWPYLILGRTDSAFKDPDAKPETVDFSGPNALFGSRQQGIRLILPLKNYSLAAALEDTGGIITPSGLRPLDEDFKREPDFAFHFRANEDWGHLQVSGILRNIVTDEFGGSLQRFQGNGVALSGQVFIREKDNFQFELAAGNGLGSRIQDLSGTSSEVGFDRFGNLGTQKAWAGFLAYQHWWDESTRSTLYLSHVKVDLRDGQPADSYQQGSGAAVNVIRSLNDRLTVGGELMLGRRQNFDGQAATVSRAQMMFRYNF